MPESQIVRLPFPFGGRSDRNDFQSQPPLTTAYARNVWPDGQGGRQRGGSRPGLARAFSNTLTDQIVGMGTVNFVPSASERIVSKLVVVDSAGGLWTANDDAASLTQAASPGTIGVSGTHTLTMTERNQKLYIASHDDNQSLSETFSVLTEYDPVTNTALPFVATHGTIPRGSTCCCTWRDRLVLAGGTTDPYGVFFSAQGEFANWDFTINTVGAAVNLGVARAGLIGEPVTSLTPHADDCLLIGCPTSLWVLVGDPAQNGRLACLSGTVGVVDKHAWCVTPDGLFVFLSADGLYMIPAGCPTEQNPVSISREKIPPFLINIDRKTTSAGKLATLAYDVRHRGIHIWLTDRTSTATDPGNLHWFFDWEQKSFYEVQYEEHRFDPWVAHARDLPSSESVVYLGCDDGRIRKYVTTNDADDDGEDTEQPIESYVAWGPLSEEPDMRNLVGLDELDLTLAADSGRVDWSLFRGHSAEQAYNAMVAGQEARVGHLTAGRNPKFYPRVSGAALYLKLASRKAWAYEAGVALLTKLGGIRV